MTNVHIEFKDIKMNRMPPWPYWSNLGLSAHWMASNQQSSGHQSRPLYNSTPRTVQQRVWGLMGHLHWNPIMASTPDSNYLDSMATINRRARECVRLCAGESLRCELLKTSAQLLVTVSLPIVSSAQLLIFQLSARNKRPLLPFVSLFSLSR